MTPEEEKLAQMRLRLRERNDAEDRQLDAFIRSTLTDEELARDREVLRQLAREARRPLVHSPLEWLRLRPRWILLAPLAVAAVVLVALLRPSPVLEFAMVDPDRAETHLPGTLRLDLRAGGSVELRGTGLSLRGSLGESWRLLADHAYETDVVLRGRDAVGQEGVFTGQLSVTNSAGVPAAATAARITGVNFKGSFKINNGAAQPVDDSYQPAK
jgi:hypothetical protein